MQILASKFLGNPPKITSNIFFVTGDDDFLVDKTISYLKGKLVNKETEIINLYGDSCEIGEIFQSLENLSFLYKKKLILLKHFNKILQKKRKAVLEYLNKEIPRDINFILTSDKFDKRNKTTSTLFKKHLAIDCKKPYGASDVIRFLKNTNLKFTNDAFGEFAHNVELNFATINKECEKLFLLFGNKTSIKSSDIKYYLLGSKNHNIFGLQNYLGVKNISNSLNLIEELIAHGTSEIMIIGMLTKFFITIYKVVCLKKKYSDFEITSEYLKEVYPVFRKNYLKFAGNYTKKELLQIFLLLLETDGSLKSVSVDKKLLLELLVAKICRSIK